MNICVEGPDNSGKSTLVADLAQIFERKIVHASEPSTHAEAWNAFNEEIDTEGQLILDRSQAISGVIYDTVVRKCEPTFSHDEIVDVAQDTLLIICLPPKDLVLADNGRDQMAGVNENLSALYDEYAMLVHGDHDYTEGSIAGNSVFVFDYTKHNLGDVIDWITDTLGGPLF